MTYEEAAKILDGQYIGMCAPQEVCEAVELAARVLRSVASASADAEKGFDEYWASPERNHAHVIELLGYLGTWNARGGHLVLETNKASYLAGHAAALAASEANVRVAEHEKNANTVFCTYCSWQTDTSEGVLARIQAHHRECEHNPLVQRITTLEAELAQKTAENANAMEIIESYQDSLIRRKAERDTALAELATAREECERFQAELAKVKRERDDYSEYLPCHD